jgi:hypothetical protein
MGVYVGGHFDGGMPQQVLCCLQVDTSPVKIGRVAVPLWHNKDKSEFPEKSREIGFVLILFPRKKLKMEGKKDIVLR